MDNVLKNDMKLLELQIVCSGMSLEELIFDRLDMGWPELLYDLHPRIVERRAYFDDLQEDMALSRQANDRMNDGQEPIEVDLEDL